MFTTRYSSCGKRGADRLDAFEKMMSAHSGDPETDKAFGEIMKDYHGLVISGRREIFKLEA